MNAYANTTQQNKAGAITENLHGRQPGGNAVGLVDNRTGAVAQRKLLEVENSSMQIQQHKVYQAMADDYSAKQYRPLVFGVNKETGSGNPPVVQRQEISPEDAEKAMKIRGGAFRNLPYKIILPYGDDPYDTNCHGYTINGKVGADAYGDELLDNIGKDDAVAVFVKGNDIAHSGRYSGNKLTHFLIGIGVVESTISLDNTAGYTARYNLPDDRDALDQFVDKTNKIKKMEQDAADRRRLVERILDHANSVNEKVAKGVTISDYDKLKNDDARDSFITKNLEEINRVRKIVNEKHDGEYEEVE